MKDYFNFNHVFNETPTPEEQAHLDNYAQEMDGFIGNAYSIATGLQSVYNFVSAASSITNVIDDAAPMVSDRWAGFVDVPLNSPVNTPMDFDAEIEFDMAAPSLPDVDTAFYEPAYGAATSFGEVAPRFVVPAFVPLTVAGTAGYLLRSFYTPSGAQVGGSTVVYEPPTVREIPTRPSGPVNVPPNIVSSNGSAPRGLPASIHLQQLNTNPSSYYPSQQNNSLTQWLRTPPNPRNQNRLRKRRKGRR